MSETPPSPSLPPVPPIPAELRPRIDRMRQDLEKLGFDQVLYALGKLPKALLTHPEILAIRGLMECRSGRFDNGIAILERAARMDPTSESVACDLGEMLWYAERRQESLQFLGAHHEANPTQTQPLRHLVDFLYRVGNVPSAYVYAERLAALAPDDVDTLFIMAYRNADLRRYDTALELFARAAERKPADKRAMQGRVFAMLYGGKDPVEIRRVTEAWCRAAHGDLPRGAPKKPKDPAGRKVRIGYVSGDFRKHVVFSFFGPVLQHHDRSKFDVTLYSSNPRSDDRTEYCKEHCDRFRDIKHMPDQQAAELIREDGIDLLIDLSGHTDTNRLAVFARRPAPVQASYLGYPATTGMPEIDYRITDAIADPQGMTEAFHTEKLYRLPRSAWAYHQLDPADIDITEPTRAQRAESEGVFTFGSFNLLTKVNQASIALWSRVLAATAPGSRMFMTDRHGLLGDPQAVDYLRDEFAAGGADLGRVLLASWVPDGLVQRGRLREVDLMLDPLSYNGTTTTCEALWHGVPTLTLPGRAHVSRVGSSLLTAMGLPDFIARDETDFIAKAKALTENPGQLSALRPTLRTRLQASPLGDFESLTRALEAAYLDMISTAARS